MKINIGFNCIAMICALTYFVLWYSEAMETV